MAEPGWHYWQAFTAPGLAGNPCAISQTVKALPTSLPAGDHTRCLSTALASKQAQVRCYDANGVTIACCGHGLLCSAQLWLSLWQGSGELLMGATTVPCWREDDTNWLRFSVLPVAAQPIESWIRSTLGVNPLRCAHVGGTQDYYVIEVSEGANLASVLTPSANLMAFTERALIVCQRMTNGPFGEHCRYRYFAPQYGVTEDIATGSAMRALLCYWRYWGATGKLTAWQQSVPGGLLLGDIQHQSVTVGGRVISLEDS